MNVAICEDALLLPPNAPKGESGGRDHYAGVYDSARQPVEGSVLMRRGKPVKRFSLFELDDAPAIANEAIFGGVWIANFGHFLLETLARAWFLRSRPDLPICWLTLGNGCMAWQRELLDLLGVHNPILLASRPAMVRRLLVPEAGFTIGGAFEADQIAALTISRGDKPKRGKHVWLSRSGLRDGLVMDESAIEADLGAAGWTVFRPEAHCVAEQLAMLRDAERIAGFIGSAFHTLVLLEQLRARIDIFCRTAELNDNYDIIAAARGLDQRIHRPEVVRLGGRGNGANHRLVDPTLPVRVLLEGA